MDKINSKEYWNERFKSGSWEQNEGETQSVFFAQIANDAFPDWLKTELSEKEMSVYDYGCAQGAGTAFLASQYPNCNFFGIDIAEEAIEKAKEKHSSCSFVVGDLNADILDADVIFCSNTLEHIEQPMQVLSMFAKHAQKYLIVLVPFKDTSGIKEHINIFNETSFPETVGCHHLAFLKIIDCRDVKNSMWIGKQLLLIYSATNNNEGNNLFVSLLTSGVDAVLDAKHDNIGLLNSYITEQESIIRKIKNENRDLVSKIDALETALNEKNNENKIINNQIIDIQNEYSDYITLTNNKLSAIREEIWDKSSIAHHALARLHDVGNSVPFKAAHFAVEMKHIVSGNKSDRCLGRKWLKDRGTQTKYNYLRELSTYLTQLSNTTRLDYLFDHDEVDEVSIKALPPEDYINMVIAEYPGKTVFIMPCVVEWNIPLFQRPQQIAMALADLGYLFIYLSSGHLDDVTSPMMIRKNCMLANNNCLEIALSACNRNGKDVILDLYSTGNSYDLKWLNKLKEFDFKILYEYVDEISEDISGHKIPPAAYERHYSFLKNDNIYTVSTAKKLHDEVLKYRGSSNRTLFSGNGVDLKHFQHYSGSDDIPKEIDEIIKDNRPIIGYFGAIAKWFDYNLVIEAAKKRPDYIFLMIGPLYSGDLTFVEELKKIENIIMPGTINYNVLPSIANHFTVATIPFLINDITESTSPIKLFEYMAMGKPIVTTAMKECKNYPEVMIANDSDEYIDLIDKAIEIVNESDYEIYKKRLIEVAEQNSWLQKAREIIDLLDC